MSEIFSFPAIAGADAHILILGSMPGKASLEAHQYYAHPRNQFWPIAAELLGMPATADYALRTALLLEAGIALWDVLKSCRRKTSLDADIDQSSIVVNDFPAFFEQHPHIVRVCFNGATAEQAFRRHVLPLIDARELTLRRLPSTSPAHAGLPYQEKLRQWREALGLRL